MISCAIYDLDASKTTGPDRITAILLKMCSPELSPVLAKLYNKCLAEPCFPSCWKSSSVDGQSSPLYITNDVVPQWSVLRPTLFLVFIYDLPDEVLSRIWIYADDTNLYSSLSKSVFFEKVESTGELELDLRSILEWGDRWLVTSNTTKTKLLFFNPHRDPLLVPVEMNGIELPEVTSFRLLGLTFTRSMDWNPYIQSIAKSASR